MKLLLENWREYLNEAENSPKDILKNWEHKDAANYAQELIDRYEEPDEFSESQMTWRNISQFDETTVKDESIPHNFPKPHHDFVYSTIEIEVPEELVSVFAHATESILVDRLKNTVTARCGDINANAITIGFVQDVISNKVSQEPEEAKKEYARRIIEGDLPDWFKENTDETHT